MKLNTRKTKSDSYVVPLFRRNRASKTISLFARQDLKFKFYLEDSI